MRMNIDALSQCLKATADPSRLRLLFLCNQGELTVTDLVRITGHSQPRTSRHLKILQDAGLLESFREQHFIFYRVNRTAPYDDILSTLLGSIDVTDSTIEEDSRRLLLSARHARSSQRAMLRMKYRSGLNFTAITAISKRSESM